MSHTEFYLWSSLYLVGFGLAHSIPAVDSVKAWFEKRLGKSYGYYRIVYNLLQIGLLALFIAIFEPYNWMVWRIEPPMRWIFRGIRILCIVLMVWCLFFAFDWRSFFGITQLKSTLGKGDEPENLPLKTDGPFKYVRHPLYLATIVFFWLQPTMTALGLVFAVFCTVYAAVGSIPEERRLRRHFGADYEAYQKRTKRIIPYIF